jgi:hypothetical protein
MKRRRKGRELKEKILINVYSHRVATETLEDMLCKHDKRGKKEINKSYWHL